MEEKEESAETNVESVPESEGVSVEKKKKKRETRQAAEDSSFQMRVNSVLASNSAIERYSYDDQHELWCEVSFDMLNQADLRYDYTLFLHFWIRLSPVTKLLYFNIFLLRAESGPDVLSYLK